MLKSAKFILKEHIRNIKRIFLIGIAHAKKQTKNTSLGMGWLFIKDIVQFASFVMFRTLISGSRQIDGMFFIIYIITGSVPWKFMNEVINGGSQAIKRNGTIVKNIKFPVTIIPTIEVVSIFTRKLFTFLVPFVVILIFGDIKLFNPILFIYYFISMFVLMVSFNLISSAFIAISDDFSQLYSSLTTILFMLVPIIWSFDRLSRWPILVKIIKLNPMIYIIQGFRDAFVHGKLPTLYYSLYFWGVCILFYVVGAHVQFKMKKYYADFM